MSRLHTVNYPDIVGKIFWHYSVNYPKIEHVVYLGGLMLRQLSRTARLRQIKQLLLLTPEGMRTAELAEKLAVTKRTIYRDVDFCDPSGRKTAVAFYACLWPNRKKYSPLLYSLTFTC